MDVNLKDALGNELVIGNTYGYTLENNGLVEVVIGTLTKFSEKGRASMQVIQTRSAYSFYTAETHEEKRFGKQPGDNVGGIKILKLFPVNL